MRIKLIGLPPRSWGKDREPVIHGNGDSKLKWLEHFGKRPFERDGTMRVLAGNPFAGATEAKLVPGRFGKPSRKVRKSFLLR